MERRKFSSDISRSVESGLRIVQKGAGNYPKTEIVFLPSSNLPMLAMREASQGVTDEELRVTVRLLEPARGPA